MSDDNWPSPLAEWEEGGHLECTRREGGREGGRDEGGGRKEREERREAEGREGRERTSRMTSYQQLLVIAIP